VEIPEKNISVIADAVISHTEVEILINDKLADELMIVIEKPGEGIQISRDEKSREEVKDQRYGSDLLPALKYGVPLERFIGSPHLFRFTSVI
jgi:hypothetical protein